MVEYVLEFSRVSAEMGMEYQMSPTAAMAPKNSLFTINVCIAPNYTYMHIGVCEQPNHDQMHEDTQTHSNTIWTQRHGLEWHQQGHVVRLMMLEGRRLTMTTSIVVYGC